MTDIFISYASVDRPTARRLADALETRGWSVWWDHRSLRVGQHFDRVIEEAIHGARVVVVVWSKASVESEWVRDEATLALKEKKVASSPPRPFITESNVIMSHPHPRPIRDVFQKTAIRYLADRGEVFERPPTTGVIVNRLAQIDDLPGDLKASLTPGAGRPFRMADFIAFFTGTSREEMPPTLKAMPPPSESEQKWRGRHYVPGGDEATFYDSQRWMEARYDALRRGDGRCECCRRPPGDGVILTVNHVKPVKFFPELSCDQGNLQVLCEDCHVGKGDRDHTNWREMRRHEAEERGRGET